MMLQCSKHNVMPIVLSIIGVQERCIRWVEKLCGDFEAVLKVGREDIAIKYGYSVRQGNNLAPTLFIIVMQLVVEDIIEALIEAKAAAVLLKIMQSTSGYRVLRLNSETDLANMDKKTINIFMCAYNGVVLFNSRCDLYTECKIICERMAK